MKRPFRITLLMIIVFFVAAGNGLRLGGSIFFWRTLEEYGARPLYISISGAIWLFIGLFLAWFLWQGRTLGWAVALIGAGVYTTWYWFDRLFIQVPHANWLFALFTNIIILFVFLLILISRKTRLFFQRATYERKSKNPATA
jgi:hypothetical protein